MLQQIMTGGSAIRLALVGIVGVAAIGVVYTGHKAKTNFEQLYETVEKTALKEPKLEAAKIRELAGKDPTGTEVRGPYLIEKYTYSSWLGRTHTYYAVFENDADPRVLLYHYPDHLPHWLGAPKPDVKAYETNEPVPVELTDMSEPIDSDESKGNGRKRNARGKADRRPPADDNRKRTNK